MMAWLAIGCMAQGDKVTVVGTITDTSGAVLPGSEVVLTRTSTNEQVTTSTTETGDFAFRGVVPEMYQLKASMVGFKSEVRSGLKFEVGRTYRQDFKLDVGAPTEQVEVRAEAPILKTEAAELGQEIDNKKIIQPAAEQPRRVRHPRVAHSGGAADAGQRERRRRCAV